MELLRNLFFGFPTFWGGGVAHSVLILSLVIALGLLLARIRVKRISLGLAWVLIVGIVFGHFGLTLEPNLLHFVKELGLIVFVFAIGLEVGPGFFGSFRRGGLSLNALMFGVFLISVALVLVIYYCSGTPMKTMAGIFAGAVTNTPALGAAQQAVTDVTGHDAPDIAMGYAVTYPMGVIGVILSFLILRYVLRVDTRKENREAHRGLGRTSQLTVRTLTIEVSNQMVDGKRLGDVRPFSLRSFVITRVMHHADGHDEYSIASGDTILHLGDKLMVVLAPKDEEAVTALFGHTVDYDWNSKDSGMKVRRLFLSRDDMAGKTIAELDLRSRYGVNIGIVTRNGVDYVGTPDFQLAAGDTLTAVGEELALAHAESEVSTDVYRSHYKDLVPIFIGIGLGCILAHIPFSIPGVPQPVLFGLAGGPLIVAILMGYFGTRNKWLNLSTMRSGLMLREVGINLFLACVGLQAGKDFVATVVTTQGLQWAGYGLLITMVPILIGGLVGRFVLHLNFFTLLGVLSGGNTNPPALAYANEFTTSDAANVGYTMVYPVAMFLRIIAIQVLVMVFA